jgi:threonine dehydrogenase-like Zn-dependent dehydrogenase
MRAVVMRRGRLLVDEIPEPAMDHDQMLLRPLATGVCGSDLSAMEHTAEFLQASRDSDTAMYLFDPERDLVFGHEFSAEVLEVGDNVADYTAGDRIVASPSVIDPAGDFHVVGYASDYPGSLAERVVVQNSSRHIVIPPGVSAEMATLTEPLADGFQAVARTRISPPSGALVLGCGPLGLGAVAALSERGISPIVASDYSATRRALAVRYGAHLAVDPSQSEAVSAWRDLAAPSQRLFVFDVTGAKGVLNSLLYTVPKDTRITIVGSVMVDDTIRPVLGIYKNIKIEFWGGAEDPDLGTLEVDEYAETFRRIVDGRLDVRPLITGYAGYEGTGKVFDLLRPSDPTQIEHLKILIRPDLSGDRIYAPDTVMEQTR